MKSLAKFYSIILIIFLSGCYSLNIHQTAKTIGKGNKETQVSATYNGIPSDSKEEYSSQKSEYRSYPIFQQTMGISEKTDFGYLLSVSKTGIYTKYQWIGDQHSKFAVANGAYLFGGLRALDVNWDIFAVYPEIGFAVGLEFPLFISYHPSPRFSVYSNPVLTSTYTFRGPDSENNLFDNLNPFYYRGFYKGLASGFQWVAIPASVKNKQEVKLGLEVGWGAPLNGNDYVFNVGGVIIFKLLNE